MIARTSGSRCSALFWTSTAPGRLATTVSTCDGDLAQLVEVVALDVDAQTAAAAASERARDARPDLGLGDLPCDAADVVQHLEDRALAVALSLSWTAIEALRVPPPPPKPPPPPTEVKTF